MKSDKKMWEICLEIYRALYKAATPSADFDAVWKEYGDKEFYSKYYLDMEEQELILEEIIKAHKCTKWERDSIRFTILLGASPMSVKKEG